MVDTWLQIKTCELWIKMPAGQSMTDQVSFKAVYLAALETKKFPAHMRFPAVRCASAGGKAGTGRAGRGTAAKGAAGKDSQGVDEIR